MLHKGMIDNVAVLGPLRRQTQAEISATDARETKSRTNKVVDRVIPLPAAALDIVVRRAQPANAKRPLTAEKLAALGLSGPVFTSGKGKRLRPDTMTQAWTRACARAGVVGARIHDLRHTTAAWLVQASVPLLEVSHLLRHHSIEMTQRYAHLAPHNARNAVARLETAGYDLATQADEAEKQIDNSLIFGRGDRI